MNIRIFSKIMTLTTFLSLSIFLSSGVAESFPFRTLDVGEKVPDVTLVNAKDNSTLSLHELQGAPAILLFWGADLAAKKQRSIMALTELQELLPFFAAKDIQVTVINAQGDSAATIAEVVQTAGLTLPVYLDPEQQAYGSLGLYIMPSVLLLDQNGIALAGMGYSRDMTATLKGEIEILREEKSRAEVEAELNPVMVEKSEAEKAGNRSLEMGNVLARKGQLEAAQREYEAAVTHNPQLAEAHVELGCLFFQLGKITEARQSLDAGLDIADSLRGEICAAQVTAAQGDIDIALEDLKAMLFRNSRNAELHYVLGTLYDKKENHAMAAKEYSKAYELLLRSSHLEE